MASSDPLWIVMPILAAPDLTFRAIHDCLNQTIPTRLLLINQGVDQAFREQLERLAEAEPERVFVWSHNPPLLSLSATWNRALQFCWETGAEEAWVVNNDIEVHQRTAEMLRLYLHDTHALFITAVGVTAEQFEAAQWLAGEPTEELLYTHHRGGPDFSCFLTSKVGHEKYPFDENFIPAMCEDLDCHRRYMLGLDGEKIFSINLPYHHVGGGSNTLKSLSPEARAAKERQIDQSRAYYARKWGGPVNHERYAVAFEERSAQDGVTTPELQASVVCT